jgi:hypothetical protein
MLKLYSKFTKRCHNQANMGLGRLRKARKVGASFKAYQTLSQPG